MSDKMMKGLIYPGNQVGKDPEQYGGNMIATNSMGGRIPINKIDLGTRYRENYGDIKELASSINELSLISPIAVLDKFKAGTNFSQYNTAMEEEKQYLLIAGGRRLQAVQSLGWTHIPALIFMHDLTEYEYRRMELMENLNRLNISAPEEALAIAQIHELEQQAKGGRKLSSHEGASGHSIRDTAKMLNKSHTKVAESLQHAKLIEKFPELKAAKSRKEMQQLMTQLEAKVSNREKAKAAEAAQGSSGDDKVKKKLIDSYILRDAVEGMKALPDAAFDFAEIDPPYAVGLDETRGDLEYGADYVEIQPDDYEGLMVPILQEAYRVLSPNSWGILWHASVWADRMFGWAIDAGFKISRIPAIWIKPTGATQNPNLLLANAYEPFFILRKGVPRIQKPGTRNVFTAMQPMRGRIHVAERPIPLIEEILSVHCKLGDTVVCPFLGSGNTLLAAYNLGMDAVGFDIGEDFRNEYIQRVARHGGGRFSHFA